MKSVEDKFREVQIFPAPEGVFAFGGDVSRIYHPSFVCFYIDEKGLLRCRPIYFTNENTTIDWHAFVVNIMTISHFNYFRDKKMEIEGFSRFEASQKLCTEILMLDIKIDEEVRELLHNIARFKNENGQE